jgi:hypothetical protein
MCTFFCFIFCWLGLLFWQGHDKQKKFAGDIFGIISVLFFNRSDGDTRSGCVFLLCAIVDYARATVGLICFYKTRYKLSTRV